MIFCFLKRWFGWRLGCLTLDIFLGFFILVSKDALSTCEFLYPVASVTHNDIIKVYLLYQKSTNHIELWLWDPVTKAVSKGLLSSFTPAGFKILPNQIGFSFIDNSRIRVKKFEKRSPKSIDIYEPIYNITNIEWIDENRFYISAKKRDRFGIFQVDTTGKIDCISYNARYDCMYPQKIDSHLFYIERSVKKGKVVSYKIVSTEYPHITYDESHDFNNDDSLEDRLQRLIEQEQDCVYKNIAPVKKEYMVDCKHKPIAFLQMISEREGFFIGYPDTVERQAKVIVFSYYQLQNKGNKWDFKHLFHFSIPTHLLFDSSDSRLFESMLPLLPRYYKNTIYYTDCSNSDAYLNLNIFSYSLLDGSIEQKTFANYDQMKFSPLVLGNMLFYGGNLSYDASSLPTMWINDEGVVCFDMPRFSI